MFTHVLARIRRIWTRLLRNPFQGIQLSHISEQDLCFDPDVERMLREGELPDAFRIFGTLEDYNRDFVMYYRSHRSDFFLDVSQKDGHFRV